MFLSNNPSSEDTCINSSNLSCFYICFRWTRIYQNRFFLCPYPKPKRVLGGGGIIFSMDPGGGVGIGQDRLVKLSYVQATSEYIT